MNTTLWRHARAATFDGSTPWGWLDDRCGLELDLSEAELETSGG